jgi:serine/threonine-protein kinase PknG
MNCNRPDCSGTIVSGYCNECGMAPSSAASGPVLSQPSMSAVTAASVTAGSRRTTSARSAATTRHRLGAGLVEVPAVADRDPAEAILAEAEVDESRRFCARCDAPVGRSRNGSSGRTEGFCPSCGAPFSFRPKLAPGEVLGGQYEVAGCLAHGGMGWVYLAKDRNVSDRWVVLKGLLNATDESAMAAALAERRFLAEVEHPNIVKIFNFVEHDGSGYIVMEYVGGTSLKQILAARRDGNGGRADPLPIVQALAYILEILPAFSYLHGRGLLFCDFKLDNAIQTHHSLKLIDLGGVYRTDDRTSPVYGTIGYQAPEIAQTGPTIPSDLFTIGRTLALMCIDFRGYQGTHKFTLPPREDVPVFVRHESLYRFLVKATAPDPDDRFQSADEMSEQLFGVLREVVAETDGKPVPATSRLFTGELRTRTDRADWTSLPLLQVDTDDPAAGYLATLGATEPTELVDLLRDAPTRTVEVDLRLARAMIDAGDPDGAEDLVAAIVAEDEWEWRALWYRGVAALASDRPDDALAGFTAVYRAVPGELAPKLALATAAEIAGTPDEAAGWYEVVSRTDPSYTAATFGLARCRLVTGDRASALAALERVASSSSAHVDAQIARIRILLGDDGRAGAELDDVHEAATALVALPLDPERRAALDAELLTAALALVTSGSVDPDPAVTVLERPLTERELRLGLEQRYRDLARRAGDGGERIRLVDLANHVRPRTWT